ncbi:MAG: hypothetical protein RIC87_20425 [Kiloniellales bacterium]
MNTKEKKELEALREELDAARAEAAAATAESQDSKPEDGGDPEEAVERASVDEAKAKHKRLLREVELLAKRNPLAVAAAALVIGLLLGRATR